MLGIDDFESPDGVHPLWEELKRVMDSNQDNIITPNEFVEGFVALALRQPISVAQYYAATIGDGLNIGDNFKVVHAALNDAVESQVAVLEGTMMERRANRMPGLGVSSEWLLEKLTFSLCYTVLLERIKRAFDLLDLMPDGMLSIDDFVSPDGLMVDPLWEQLKRVMDTNYDGIITQQEFVESFVNLALPQPILVARYHAASNIGDHLKVVHAAFNDAVESQVTVLEGDMIERRANQIPGWEVSSPFLQE